MKIATIIHSKHTHALQKHAIIQITSETLKNTIIKDKIGSDELRIMFMSDIVDHSDKTIGTYGFHELQYFELDEIVDKDWRKWLLLVKYGKLQFDKADKDFLMASDVEHFVDEDTGEVVEIESTYVIAYKYRPVKPVFYSNKTDLEFLIEDLSVILKQF